MPKKRKLAAKIKRASNCFISSPHCFRTNKVRLYYTGVNKQSIKNAAKYLHNEKR